MKTIADIGVLVLILANFRILEGNFRFSVWSFAIGRILFHYQFLIPAAKASFVTCGSVVKLLNVDYRSRLHSHDVKYGTGSGQQSVTGVETSDDVNCWIIP